MHKLKRNSVVIRGINWWQTFVLDKQRKSDSGIVSQSPITLLKSGTYQHLCNETNKQTNTSCGFWKRYLFRVEIKVKLSKRRMQLCKCIIRHFLPFRCRSKLCELNYSAAWYREESTASRYIQKRQTSHSLQLPLCGFPPISSSFVVSKK